MASHFPKPESFPNNLLHFDALYCEEEGFDQEFSSGFTTKDEIHSRHDLIWDDEEISTLLSREKEQCRVSYSAAILDASLKTARNEAIKWMLKVISRYGFAPTTAFLAADYYSNFITSLSFQRDKPWMSHLAAVACLSIASKLEETHVPLLSDLQVDESMFVFESKTIQRMELLVLSTHKWKMNHVTPISFFDHFSRRFSLHCEFSKSCEAILLPVISDIRFVEFPPSVIAAAAMKYVLRKLNPNNAENSENEIATVLGLNKECVDGCHKLIAEAVGGNEQLVGSKKRSFPSSPSGVIDAYFSSDNSNDSWVV
ncbi:hypothetical protein M569_02902, partial [Genlisea aurea]